MTKFRERGVVVLALLILAAHSNTPPIQLPPPDNRRIYLVPDQLFDFTLGNPNFGYLENTYGILDSNGKATATITIPNNPALIGVPLYFAVIVLDPTTPSSIVRISHTVKVIIQ